MNADLVVTMTIAQLRELVREAVRDALAEERAPKDETLYEPISAFARRLGVSRRHVFDLRARGAIVVVGEGRAVRVDVRRSLDLLRERATANADNEIEQRARRDAARAAKKTAA